VLGIGAGRTPESRAFASGVAFEAWALLLAATVALWVAIFAFLWRSIIEAFGRIRARTVGGPLAGYAVIAMLVLGSLFFVGEGAPPNPLYASTVKVQAIVTVVFLLGAPAAVALWLIQSTVSHLARALSLAPPVAIVEAVEGANTATSTRDLVRSAAGTQDGTVAGRSRADWVATLLGLRRLTQRILIAVSLGISAAVLSTGALRNALLEARAVTAETFPSSWVLLYGALFTVVFVFVFVPSLLEWRGVASRLVDHAYPIPHDGRPTQAWHDGRQHMNRMLGLDASPLRALGPLLGIASPVLISIAAIFVPEIGAG
jgi:hypothetical protein